MSTRKELIIKKYTELESIIKTHVDVSLFPSLEDYDTADLVYYITLIFMGIQTEEQFKGR